MLEVKTMKKRPSFEEFKKRALENEEVKATYDLLEAEFAVLEKFIMARKHARLDTINRSSRPQRFKRKER